MLLHVPQVLSPDALARCRAILDAADWQDGKITTGSQSEQVNSNHQLAGGAPTSAAAHAIMALRTRHSDTGEVVKLTGCYHNPLRLSAQT